jgi:acyl dehydratase
VPTTFETLDALRDAAGTHLGWTDWMEVDQARVEQFADATGDHEWIHDYLTLALSNRFLPELLQVPGASAGVNYGTGTVRFPAPVPVGSRIRGGAEIAAVEEIPGGLQTTIAITIEVEGSAKPACVVESLSRWLA